MAAESRFGESNPDVDPQIRTCCKTLALVASHCCNFAHFERIKEKVPVELVEEGVEEDEGPAALASHPMTTEGSSHEEEAADCRQ